MRNEAIELADTIDNSEETTGFERRMASVMRSQAAEIERLKVSNDKLIHDLDAVAYRKDALLRECLRQGADQPAAGATMGRGASSAL